MSDDIFLLLVGLAFIFFVAQGTIIWQRVRVRRNPDAQILVSFLLSLVLMVAISAIVVFGINLMTIGRLLG